MIFKSLESKVFDHIVNEENSKFVGIFRLSWLEDVGKDIFNQEVGEGNGQIGMSLKDLADKLGNSNLNFFFLLDFLVEDVLIFFI